MNLLIAAVTRQDVADYVRTLALVYLVIIFIRIIVSWIPRVPYNRWLSATTIPAVAAAACGPPILTPRSIWRSGC